MYAYLIGSITRITITVPVPTPSQPTRNSVNMLTERNMMMKMNTNVTTEAYTKKPRRNCYSPTSTKTITPFPSSSHFPRSCTPGNHFPLSSSSLLWCVILLLLYCPTYMVNGLPLMMTKRSNHGLGQDVILHSS